MSVFDGLERFRDSESCTSVNKMPLTTVLLTGRLLAVDKASYCLKLVQL